MNKRVEYGIIALLYLSSKADQIASVREISATCGVPEALLSKIMQTLKNFGLVTATHGNQGGYHLIKPLANINLLELSGALVGPVRVAECLQPGNEDCPVKQNCTIITPMSALNQKIVDLFQQTSLDSLATRKVAL